MLADATIYRDQGAGQGVLMHEPASGARWCATVHWNKPHVPPVLPVDGHLSATVAAVARVYEGAWIVDCPCGGAQYACRTDRRLFCPDCLNAAAGGAWVPVTWPAGVDAVEAALERRPVATTRNWRPPETVADLLAENAAKGVM